MTDRSHRGRAKDVLFGLFAIVLAIAAAVVAIAEFDNHPAAWIAAMALVAIMGGLALSVMTSQSPPEPQPREIDHGWSKANTVTGQHQAISPAAPDDRESYGKIWSERNEPEAANSDWLHAPAEDAPDVWSDHPLDRPAPYSALAPEAEASPDAWDGPLNTYPPPAHRHRRVTAETDLPPGRRYEATGEHRIGELLDEHAAGATPAETIEALKSVVVALDATVAEQAALLAVAYVDPMLKRLQDYGAPATAENLARWAGVNVESSAFTDRTLRAMQARLLRRDRDGMYYLPAENNHPDHDPLLADDEAEGLAAMLPLETP